MTVLNAGLPWYSGSYLLYSVVSQSADIAGVIYLYTVMHGDVDIPPISVLIRSLCCGVWSVCFSFSQVGGVFLVLHELEPLRWSRLCDVAAEIKLRSRIFPIYFRNINGWILIMEYLSDYCLWDIYWTTFYWINLLDYFQLD